MGIMHLPNLEGDVYTNKKIITLQWWNLWRGFQLAENRKNGHSAGEILPNTRIKESFDFTLLYGYGNKKGPIIGYGIAYVLDL